MDRALSAVRNGDMGLNASARMFNVPKATLKRHLDDKNKFANDDKKHLGRSTILPPEIENAKVIGFMCEHFEQYSEIQEDVINADMPPMIRYNTMHERIEAMAKPTEMVGEFEIIAACEAIERAIFIFSVDQNQGHLLKYGEQFQLHPPLMIRYTSLAPEVGHYECVLNTRTPVGHTRSLSPDHTDSQHPKSGPKSGTDLEALQDCGSTLSTVSDSELSPRMNAQSRKRVTVTDICPIPWKESTATRRTSRTSVSQILTASPYKDALSVAKEKATNRGKRSNRCPKRKDSSHKIAKPKRGQNKKNKKAQSLTDSQEGVDADWYCFLYGETRVESMVQCQSCKRWVHTECSNESDTSGYKCDLC